MGCKEYFESMKVLEKNKQILFSSIVVGKSFKAWMKLRNYSGKDKFNKKQKDKATMKPLYSKRFS